MHNALIELIAEEIHGLMDKAQAEALPLGLLVSEGDCGTASHHLNAVASNLSKGMEWANALRLNCEAS